MPDEAGSVRGGRVSHGVGAAVPAGADAFHDRVRDGTGWVRIALGHGQAPPPASVFSSAWNVVHCLNNDSDDDEYPSESRFLPA